MLCPRRARPPVGRGLNSPRRIARFLVRLGSGGLGVCSSKNRRASDSVGGWAGDQCGSQTAICRTSGDRISKNNLEKSKVILERNRAKTWGSKYWDDVRVGPNVRESGRPQPRASDHRRIDWLSKVTQLSDRE